MWLNQDVSRYCPHTGDLYVDFRRYGFDALLRYGRWRENWVDIHRWSGRKWIPQVEDPCIALCRKFDHQNLLPVNQYLKEIPGGIIDRASRFDYLQTTMLQALSMSKEAGEFFDSAPVLFWLIMEKLSPLFLKSKALSLFLSMKRVDFLNGMFHANHFTPAHVKLLNKIILKKGDLFELSQIKNALRAEHCAKAFRHWKRVPVAVLSEWKYTRDLPSFNGLLREAMEQNDLANSVDSTIGKLKRSINVATQLGIPNPRGYLLARCRSLTRLNDVQNELTDRLGLAGNNDHDVPDEFPQPPIPGNEVIRAITTNAELYEEGRIMRHCIASYGGDIAEGRCSAYSVYVPQRGTLTTTGSGVTARVLAFKLEANAEPSPESWASVNDWLEKHKV